MKNITEFINEALNNSIQVQEIGRKSVSGSWSDHGKKIASAWKSIPNDLKSIIEDNVYEEIKNFYDNTPKKRNIASMVMINVKMDIATDPIYNKLKKLYERIGMAHWMLNFPKEICSGEFIGTSTSREGGSDKSKVNIKEHFYNTWKQPDHLPGNGYNNLPGEIIEEYRDKFMDCITGSVIVVRKDQVRSWKAKANVPRYEVVYNAVYDKTKANALIDEIQEKLQSEDNGSLGRYAKHLAVTNGAISKYYSSKRSGDYTGD